MVCNRHGFPFAFSLSAGQRADSIYLTELLEKVRLLGRSGRPRKRSRYFVADEGDDSGCVTGLLHALRHATDYVAAPHASTPKTRPSP